MTTIAEAFVAAANASVRKEFEVDRLEALRLGGLEVSSYTFQFEDGSRAYLSLSDWQHERPY